MEEVPSLSSSPVVETIDFCVNWFVVLGGSRKEKNKLSLYNLKQIWGEWEKARLQSHCHAANLPSVQKQLLGDGR